MNKQVNTFESNINEFEAFQKEMRIIGAKILIEKRNDFKAYFNGLYDSLNNRYNSEKNHSKSGQIKMLEDFINEINEAVYKYKNNSNVHVNNEEFKIKSLLSLRDNFENILNDLYNSKELKTQ